MSFFALCMLSLLQVSNSADEIRNPNISVVAVPEIALAGAKYPGMSLDASGVLHLWYFREFEGRMRLEMRRQIDGKFTSPTLVSASPKLMVNWADTPRFAGGKDGSSIITWLESNGHGYGVKFAFSRESGAAFTAPQWLHQDQKGAEHGFVSLVPLADGGFFAVWLQGGSFGDEGAYQTSLVSVVVNADGSLAENEIILDELVCDCCDTDAAIFGSGNVVVTYRDRSAAEERDVYYVRGNPLQPDSFSSPLPLLVEKWVPEGCPVNGPAFDNIDRHGAIAIFSDLDWQVPRLQITQTKGGGKKFGLPSVVSAKGTIGRADVAYLPEGIPVVAWLQEMDEQVWWVARAIPRKGMPGPIEKIAQVSGNRSDGFISLVAREDSVLACYTDKEKLSFSVIKFKKAAANAVDGQLEK
ncbi:MAG: hypothetical protein H8E25_13295 [Planctomycetes bacterium]|nr:hypothetical protein [Planctomycetota bacterium]